MPTTATFLGYPFDQELFMQMWSEVPDPRLAAMITSGAVVTDAAIQSQIANDGNFFTIPFYNILEGDEQNYNGMTDITLSETTGTSQSGVVYGRAKAFSARNFQAELSGSDPMGHIVSTFGKYWQNKEQLRLVKLANALFATTDTDANAVKFKKDHILDTDAPVEATDANRLMTKSLGDNKDAFSLAIMHSIVAERLENLELLEFRTQTDAMGIQRKIRIADWNGITVILDDNVSQETGGKYATYFFGSGAIRRAEGRLDVPVEVNRDPLKFGGQDYMVTRIRRAIHPNGFSFAVPSGMEGSPTDVMLHSGSNWKVIFNPKAIPIAKLVTKEEVII